MELIGIVPARYKSTRFPGKPIAELCGKPMIWWAYNNLRAVEDVKSVYVATDDELIAEVCNRYGMNYLMTSGEHETHLDRLYEVSTMIDADFYINVNGDEPLIDPKSINRIIPDVKTDCESCYVANLMTRIKDPVDAVDTSKIKIVTDIYGYAMYMARYPIPFPKGRADFSYYKFVGAQCFTKKALEFAYNQKRGPIESIEDIDEYRFLENGVNIKFIAVDVNNVSVDTQKDLKKAEMILSKGASK